MNLARNIIGISLMVLLFSGVCGKCDVCMTCVVCRTP
jgi:hypothetical protein